MKGTPDERTPDERTPDERTPDERTPDKKEQKTDKNLVFKLIPFCYNRKVVGDVNCKFACIILNKGCVKTMTLKDKKGYSLIEIGVGILILTLFLFCSIALFNGCYNTYRMIQQRNIATNYAVRELEKMLQTDADILTGFFTETYNEATNQYELVANETFKNFVSGSFETDLKERYARLNNVEVADVGTLSDSELEDYIYEDKDYLISFYVKDYLEGLSDTEYESEEVKNGNYALFVPSVTQQGSLTTPANSNNMIIRKTITRLPVTDYEEAFGNKILKLKVEIFYTARINNRGVTEDDLKSITLETVKVASTSN